MPRGEWTGLRHRCTTCGAPTGRFARFCWSCGAPVVPGGPSPLNRVRLDPTAGKLDLVTARPKDSAVMGGDTQPTLTGAGATTATWWALPRNRTAVAVVSCGMLLGLAVGLAFAGGTTFGSGTPAKSAAPHARARAPRAHAAPAPVPRSASQGSDVAALERVLQLAATGHAELVAAVSNAQSVCPASAFVASQQIASVVSNRSAAIRELDALPASADPQSAALRGVLAQALQASAEADTHYEAWTAALASAVPGCAAGDGTADYAAARLADAAATAYKSEFVAGFNPVAARAGLSTWAPTDV